MKAQILMLCGIFVLNAAMLSAQKKKIQDEVKIEGLYIKDTIVYAPITTLLRHVPQTVKITSSQYPLLTAEVDSGTIVDMGKGFFVVTPTATSKLTLRVYKNEKKSKLIAIYEYAVVRMPSPKCYYGGKSSGEVRRKDLLADSMLYFSTDTKLLPFKYRVIGFKTSFVIKDEDPILDIPSESNSIPERVKKIIKAAPAGTKLYFEYIKARVYSVQLSGEGVSVGLAGDPGVRALEPLSFIIEDE